MNITQTAAVNRLLLIYTPGVDRGYSHYKDIVRYPAGIYHL